MFPLSQYIVQGIAETVPNGTHIIQGKDSRILAYSTYRGLFLIYMAIGYDSSFSREKWLQRKIT